MARRADDTRNEEGCLVSTKDRRKPVEKGQLTGQYGPGPTMLVDVTSAMLNKRCDTAVPL
jgi:hypothetical protein